MREFPLRFGLYSAGVAFKSGANPGSNGNGTSTTTSKVELPAWVDSASQSNYGQAVQVADSLKGPDTANRVAGMTPEAQASIAALQGNAGSTDAAFKSAQGTTAGVAGYTPANVNAGLLANTDLNPYMNPYTKDVTNAGLSALEVQRQQAQNGNADMAIKSKAFGGSRFGVQSAVTDAASAVGAGNLVANSNAANFAQAQAAATGDLNRTLTADTTNQQAGLTGAGLNLSAAAQEGQLATQGQSAFLAGNQAALQGQTLLQQQEQAKLDAAHQLYTEQQQFPVQQLQIKEGALGMSPYGQTQTSTSPVAQGNGAMQTAGTVGAGIGLLGSLASAAPAFMAMSDETMKTDITKVGKDKATGLTQYAYRYKRDPKSYPKVVGPMAQDIAKKFPGQTANVGGKIAVNLGFGPMQDAFRG